MQNQFVAIHQFDGDAKLLKIELATGRRWIIPRDQVDEKDVTFGMFDVEKLEPELETVALLATSEGPLLFFKDLQYRPDIRKTKITVEEDARFSHFLVVDDAVPVFGLFYEKKFGIGLHPYLKEREDFDFYYWLSKNINNKRLYRAYTRNIKYMNTGGSR